MNRRGRLPWRVLGGAAGVLLSLGVGLIAFAALRIDAPALGSTLARALEAQIGAPVQVDALDLALFPLPALRARGVKIGAADAAPRLEAQELRLRVSLLGLLFGRVALRSVEIDAPRLVLDASGSLWPSGPRVDTETQGLPLLAITHIALREGSVTFGEWQAQAIDADARIGLDLSAQVTLSGDVPGLGRVREARVRVSRLYADQPRWDAHVRLDDVDLAALRARLALPTPVQGRVRAELEASGSAGATERASLALEAAGLELRAASFGLAGNVALAGRWPGELQLDLRDATLGADGILRKPAGTPLLLHARMRGAPALAAGLGALESLGLESEAIALRADVVDAGAEPRVQLRGGSIDLAVMRDWWTTPLAPRSGTIRIDEATLGPDIALQGTLERVVLPFERVVDFMREPNAAPPAAAAPGELGASGRFALAGGRVTVDPLELELGAQRARLHGSLDLATRAFSLAFDLDDVDLERAAAAATQELPLRGRLSAWGAFDGDARSLESLRGQGGVRLLSASLGGVSIPWPAELQGLRRDAHSDAELLDRFEARFQLVDASARFGLLALDHSYASIELAGDVGMRDGALDLTGRLLLRRELSAQLGAGERERAIPIEHVGGTLRAPDFKLGALARSDLAELMATYARASRPREAAEPAAP